ncbi:hypothetical protein K1T71_010319 [Dendrolimus kikuchii]|uniref:Uncharacterized protein n=1 Tax=Dendrolimus kikuchii TaxID=765133 RepID=A0ACC1CR78_9NEOP|nr:hypothetical protein K1T71_010319 [Dendrolimus kikuchii]
MLTFRILIVTIRVFNKAQQCDDEIVKKDKKGKKSKKDKSSKRAKWTKKDKKVKEMKIDLNNKSLKTIEEYRNEDLLCAAVEWCSQILKKNKNRRGVYTRSTYKTNEVDINISPNKRNSSLKRKFREQRNGLETWNHIGSKESYQRARPLKFKNRREDAASTRMTPMYLMQKSPDDDLENKQDKLTTRYSGVEENRVHPTTLSPYSLQETLINIVAGFPEANASFEIIGRTAEYNDIILIKFSEVKSDIGKYFRAEESKYIDEVPEKKIVFIVHGLSVMGFQELSCLSGEKRFKILLSFYLAHLDKFDIFLIPMANPDGVTVRHKIWNKNLSPQAACQGVSLDRNFDVAWNSSRTISPCSPQYPGPSAFSEPETRAIRDVFHHYSHKIIAYLHVHGGTYSYNVFKGDSVLYPKGYTDVQSDDDKYIDLKGEIDEAMKNASFQVMTVTVDTLHTWYGKVSGTSVDYAATVYGIPYTMELVMQIYEDNDLVNKSIERVSFNALNEVWKRVIDVILNNIWKNTHSTTDGQK